MSAAPAIGLVAGLLIGLAAIPLVRHLPLGISERLEQPAWAQRATRPAALAGAGLVAGGAVGLIAPDPLALATGLILVAVLVPATAIDLAWRVVPDSLVLGGLVACLGALAVLAPERIGVHLAAGGAACLVALALALAARGGLGLGDVKLMAVLGLALGGAVLTAAVAAITAAGALAAWLLVRRGRGATLPLVPFLAGGALVAVGAGPFPLG